MDLDMYYVGENFRMKTKEKAFYLEIGEHNLLNTSLLRLIEQASSKRLLKRQPQSVETLKTARRIVTHLDKIKEGYGLGLRSSEDVSVVIARFSQKMIKLLQRIVGDKIASTLLSRDDIFRELADTDASGQVTELFTKLGQLGKLLIVLRRLQNKLEEHVK